VVRVASVLPATHPALDALGPVAALDPSLLAPYMAQAQARALRVEDPDGIPLYEIEGDGVAVIRVEGPLARRTLAWRGMVWFDGYDRIARAHLAADADPAVRARLQVIDSPGGAAAGLFDATRQVLEGTTRTPLVSYSERAASAGYALFAMADEGYVGSEDAVGSIGTIIVHTDISRALENAGVKMTAIVDPAGKANAWPYWSLSDEAKANLQEDVSALSQTFYEHVAAQRGLTVEAVKGLNARMFSGRKAVDAGLADGVASRSQVIARAETLGREKERERVEKVYSLLGLPATATVEEVNRAAASAAPLLELGRAALDATGEKEPVAAKGALKAMAEDAAEAATLRATVAANAAKAEKEERHGLLVKLAQVEPPALVWADTNATSKGPVPELAEMSTPALRSYVERRTNRPQPPATKVLTGATKTTTREPTDDEVKAHMKCEGIKNEGVARADLKVRMAEGMV
jgi:ClpP class serine protease